MSDSDENSVKQVIEARLKEHLQPHFLQVEDVSWQHTGHAGARPGGQSHFEVTIGAEKLAGLSRVAAHRAVNQAVADLLAGPIHALQITIWRN
jgi:BolA protein